MPLRVGTFQAGANLASTAWDRSFKFVFEVDPLLAEVNKTWPGRPSVPVQRGGSLERCGKQFLADHPVDILIVDHSRDSSLARSTQPVWEEWLESCPEEDRPSLIIQTWRLMSMLADEGPMSKHARKRASILGYTSRCSFVNNLQCGGSVQQDRLVVCNFRNSAVPKSIVEG